MLAKQLGEKWPNFYLSANHPDDNLKQIGAPFFLLKLYIIKHMWNATHKIFLELLVSDCQKKLYNLYVLQTKSFYVSPAVSNYYGTEIEIWAGFQLNT